MSLLHKLFSDTVEEDIVVIDGQFPQRNPLGFRNTEINTYLKKIKNFTAYTMYPMRPGQDAWFHHGYGIKKSEFKYNKQGYLKYYPENTKRIKYLEKNKNYNFKLAYSFFLAETYVLLPFLEKNQIPFVFVLYPGGAFGLENESSDNMLKKIFASKYFRQVIVTQEITEHYLITKNLCERDKISYIYGGFVQFEKSEVKKRKYYSLDKENLDICFVAAKYSHRGIDKGYDKFIEVAKRLSKKHENIKFHVIGNFSSEDIDISEIEPKITFYGFQQADFLNNFYSEMDIFLAPNLPHKLYEGNFDGFPLGIDAGYCGVALFVSDKLKMNKYYTDHKDIVIISDNPEEIEEKILHYYLNPTVLQKLALQGQYTTQELFDIERQINQRMDVFEKFVKLHRAEGVI